MRYSEEGTIVKFLAREQEKRVYVRKMFWRMILVSSQSITRQSLAAVSWLRPKSLNLVEEKSKRHPHPKPAEN